MKPDQILNLKLYKTMHLIRAAQEAIGKRYLKDEMKTPIHMSMGEEAIAAGICQALKKTDQVFGYYRSHALYIAKTHEVEHFFGELYGKKTGALQGRGGSMHLASPKHGFMLSSAIVASTIAPAIGAAFANLKKKNNRIVVSFFGDGAIEEGVFFESLNMASLMKLPIIFVCQDNGLAADIDRTRRQGFISIPKIASSFNCHVLESDGFDPHNIYTLTKKAINLIYQTQKPVFMYLSYHRMSEHMGVGLYNDAMVDGNRDPVLSMRKKLQDAGNSIEIKKIEKENNKKVALAIRLAKKAKSPKPADLYKHVFAR